MSLSAADITIMIENQVIFDTSTCWKPKQKDSKEGAVGDKSTLEYILCKGDEIVGSLILKTNPISRITFPADPDSEFTIENELYLILNIQRSIIINNIEEWISEHCSHIKTLSGETSLNDSTFSIFFPKFKADMLGVNQTSRNILSTIINSQDILEELYKASQEFTSSSKLRVPFITLNEDISKTERKEGTLKKEIIFTKIKPTNHKQEMPINSSALLSLKIDESKRPSINTDKS